MDDQNISFRFESQEVKRSIECSNPINKIEKICHSSQNFRPGGRDILGKELNIWHSIKDCFDEREQARSMKKWSIAAENMGLCKNISTFVKHNFENPIKMSHHIRFSPRQHFAWNGWTLHVSATTKGWYRKLNAGVFCKMYF